MILSADYSRIRASTPEPHLGWRHFVHELNTFLNKHVTKDTNGLEYVTLGSTDQTAPSQDQATLQVFLGQDPPVDYDSEKLISGTRYFLGEHGISVLQSHRGDDTLDLVVSGLSRFEVPPEYQDIKNTWMRQNLLSGTIVDVRQVGTETEPGVFRLNHFIPATTYVDPVTEEFIQSIGKDRASGEILAAYDTRFYQDDDYETLYLA